MGFLFDNGFGGKLPSIQLGQQHCVWWRRCLGQDTGYFPWNNANPTYTYRDNVTKILGKHTLQFGALCRLCAEKRSRTLPTSRAF